LLFQIHRRWRGLEWTLGLKILYKELNEIEGFLAERTYLPWKTDRQMRSAEFLCNL
jgi:hypothetical protein